MGDVPDGEDLAAIEWLIDEGVVDAPKEQWGEIKALQDAFDAGHPKRLAEMLARRGLRWPT